MQLFVDIAKYTSRYMSGKRAPENESINDVPGAKKRKTEETTTSAGAVAPTNVDTKGISNVLYSAPDTSLAVPQRKKMTVQLAADPQRLGEGAVRILHEASGVNLAIPFSKIGKVTLGASLIFEANSHNRASILPTSAGKGPTTVELCHLRQRNHRSQDRRKSIRCRTDCLDHARNRRCQHQGRRWLRAPASRYICY